MQINTAFHKHLRSALNHFYDHEYLRQCELAVDLGIATRFDAPAALRKILTDAIDALKPASGEYIGSTPRQLYDVLLYRYVQQFEQDEVAHQLGVSERHMRRIQSEALDALACHLWEKHHLDDRLIATSEAATGQPGPSNGADDLDWLKGTQQERVSDTRQALMNILDLMRPLTTHHHVHLDFDAADVIPDLAIHPVALRQIMLNLLGVAVHRANGGTTSLQVQPHGPIVRIEIDANAPVAPPTVMVEWDNEQERSLLNIAAHLSALCGSQLAVTGDAQHFNAVVSIPAIDSLIVLVIDDNEDIIHLLQRYASGTSYLVLGTTQPERVFDILQDHDVRIIVLDAMMPKVDGWEMLGRLRQHPRSANIPVVILTILAQEELALSLGARAHLMKPVTQESFLNALDRISNRAPDRVSN